MEHAKTIELATAAPDASILLIGPPDCGNPRPLIHLTEVIDIQRELATRLNLAFWDWRLHMGGPGIVKRWVTAGLSQGEVQLRRQFALDINHFGEMKQRAGIAAIGRADEQDGSVGRGGADAGDDGTQ